MFFNLNDVLSIKKLLLSSCDDDKVDNFVNDLK